MLLSLYPECCVMFSGVKLSMGSFVLFLFSSKETCIWSIKDVILLLR